MSLKRFYCFFVSVVVMSNCKSFSQNDSTKDYIRLIDSAFLKIDNEPKSAFQFLDSIPLPLEKHLKGCLAEYYNVKALAYESLNEREKLFENFLLALQYAEMEKNYDIAGNASLELFYNLYIIKKDATAFDYLNKAKDYYKKADNKFGLLDVMQMEAFAEFYNENYIKSNELILPKLSYYKSIKEDGFYYLYPLFMLTSNYIHVKDEKNTKKYYSLFNELQHDSTIPSSLFKKHEVSLLICMAEPYLEKVELDSAYSYLSKAGDLRKYMNSSDVKNYFENFIEYYHLEGDDIAQENYADSLEIFQNQIIEKAMNANFKVSQKLIKTNENLTEESKSKTLNRALIVVLVGLLLALIAFVVLRYKQIKAKFQELSKRKKEHEFLQTNHEKLQVKFKGLEGFIKEIKKEIKKISLLSDTEIQHQKIKDLYMNIHHNSSTLLSEGDNHFNLVSELNIDFFTKLSSTHTNLNQSELMICYYMITGFKNKEIATFLNSSIRAVESKRYRISKKIGLSSSNFSLLDYLKNNFSLPLSE